MSLLLCRGATCRFSSGQVLCRVCDNHDFSLLPVVPLGGVVQRRTCCRNSHHQHCLHEPTGRFCLSRCNLFTLTFHSHYGRRKCSGNPTIHNRFCVHSLQQTNPQTKQRVDCGGPTRAFSGPLCVFSGLLCAFSCYSVRLVNGAV